MPQLRRHLESQAESHTYNRKIEENQKAFRYHGAGQCRLAAETIVEILFLSSSNFRLIEILFRISAVPRRHQRNSRGSFIPSRSGALSQRPRIFGGTNHPPHDSRNNSAPWLVALTAASTGNPAAM
jgi:hypothetical protein